MENFLQLHKSRTKKIVLKKFITKNSSEFLFSFRPRSLSLFFIVKDALSEFERYARICRAITYLMANK